MGVGYATGASGTSDFAIVRYSADGSLDKASPWPSSGKIISDLGGEDYATGVAIQPDGKILVGGFSADANGISDFALARYGINGALDTVGFGAGIGKVITPFGQDTEDEALDIALQNDGKIVLVGMSDSSLVLTRYLATGAVDPNFGVGGKVIETFTNSSAVANGVAIQPDGKIIIAGGLMGSQGNDFLLIRYNSNGTRDGSFGSGGVVMTDFVKGTVHGVDSATDVAIAADGSIVVAGNAVFGSDADWAVARYTSNGGLDQTFGTSGKVLLSNGDDDGSATAVALGQNGLIALAGYTNAKGTRDFQLTTLDEGGQLNKSLSNSGSTFTDFSTSDDYAQSMIIQNDGRILLAGSFNGAGGIAQYGRLSVQNFIPNASFTNSGAVSASTSIQPTVQFANILDQPIDTSPIDLANGLRYSYDFNNDGVFEAGVDIGDGTYEQGVTNSQVQVPADIKRL